MKIAKHIELSTNQGNHSGRSFFPEVLSQALEQSWQEGVPSCKTHNTHKPIAWTQGEGLLFERDAVTLLGRVFYADDQYSQSIISEKAQEYFDNLFFRRIDKQYKKALTEQFKSFMSPDAIFCNFGAIGVLDKGIVYRSYPKLFELSQKDKRTGLIPLSELKPIAPGVFELDRKYIIFASHWFRRGFSRLNSMNTQFLALFQSIAKKHSTAHILIDPDVIALRDTYMATVESEFWQNIEATETIDITMGKVTKKSNEILHDFHSITQTEFSWYMRSNKVTFECEEIIDENIAYERTDSFGCRYCHSHMAEDGSTPNHLDGAVRVYGYEDMVNRLDKELDQVEKNTLYCKLWRLEEPINVALWKKLICHYFRDNPLPGSFLGITEPSKNSSKHQNVKTLPNEIKLPRKLSGVKVFLSYLDKDTFYQPDDIVICVNEFATRKDTSFCYIESEAREIIKKLIANKIPYTFSRQDPKFVAFEDMYVHFPLIVSKGHEAVKNANRILRCFNEYVHLTKGSERQISFNIAVEHSDRFLQISLTGSTDELFSFLNSFGFSVPKETQMKNFTKGVYDSLRRKPGHISATSENMLSSLDMFKFYRWHIPSDDLEIEIKGNIVYAKTKNESIAGIWNTGVIDLTFATIIEESICMKCGRNFSECFCSKHEKGGGEKVTKMDLINFFLTDKSSFVFPS